MRAISLLLLFSGFGCALAQNSAPPPAPDNAAASASAPADARLAWLTQPVFGAGPARLWFTTILGPAWSSPAGQRVSAP